MPSETGNTLIQYWDSAEIPDYVGAALETFREMNPQLRHMVFDHEAAEAFVADNLGPREAGAFRACAVPAMQADYFRLCSAVVLGGVYADADFRCVAPLAPLIPAKGCVRVFRGPGGVVINGIFACGSSGHAFFELALEIATANVERRIPVSVYFATGAPILTTLVALHACGSNDGSVEPFDHPPLRDAARLYWPTIGSRARVARALEGVEVGSADDYRACIESPHMPYKKTDSHWVNFKGSIFGET